MKNEKTNKIAKALGKIAYEIILFALTCLLTAGILLRDATKYAWKKSAPARARLAAYLRGKLAGITAGKAKAGVR